MTDLQRFPTKFTGYYISKDGRVWRDTQKTGQKAERRPGFIELNQSLRGGNTKNGRYNSVNISIWEEEKFIKQIKYYTHRLMAETLVDNPNNYSEIDHINRDKLCNNMENLRWVTREENMEYKKEEMKGNTYWRGHEKT